MACYYFRRRRPWWLCCLRDRGEMSSAMLHARTSHTHAVALPPLSEQPVAPMDTEGLGPPSIVLDRGGIAPDAVACTPSPTSSFTRRNGSSPRDSPSASFLRNAKGRRPAGERVAGMDEAFSEPLSTSEHVEALHDGL